MQLLSKLDAVESEKAEAERSAEARVHDAEMRSTQMLAAAEARAAALEDRLRQADPMAAATPLAGDPPAMAGPGTLQLTPVSSDSYGASSSGITQSKVGKQWPPRLMPCACFENTGLLGGSAAMPPPPPHGMLKRARERCVS